MTRERKAPAPVTESAELDPVQESLRQAAVDDEPLTPAEEEAIIESYEDVRLGRVTSSKEVALLADAWPTHAGAFPDDALFQEMLAEIERQRRVADQAAG